MKVLPSLSVIGWLLCCGACTIPPYQPATPTQTTRSGEAPIEIITVPEPKGPGLESNGITPTTRQYVLSPATQALVTQAHAHTQGGDFSLAAAALERALRIEPNNPLLWLEYGQLRMSEANFVQAENMARKALATAGGDVRAQAAAWNLLADSFRARARTSEAQQAAARAQSLLSY